MKLQKVRRRKVRYDPFVKQNGKVVGVDSARLHAAIDESHEHLFAAAGYKPDMFAETFLPLEQAH